MIQLDAVSKSFRRTNVLDRVSLTLGPGERVALVGANGAGKTTLIRCLLGEYRCGGRVRIDGLCPRAERRRVLGRLGFVPQLPPPLRMPVGQLLSLASTLSGSDTADIETVARRLGLEVAPVRRQPFVKLSGGQKQKLLIAIALRPGADVLVMDEPAANLDPEARRGLIDLLREREPGATMLISIHRLDEVAGLVTRVIELDGGHVALDEPLDAAAKEVQDAVPLAPSH